MTARARTVLVVGATGILAPAAATLVARGDRVTGASRGGRTAPDGVETLVVDARDTDALVRAIEGRHWDAALVYAPAVTAASLPELRDRVDTLVLVRVSAAVDPALGEPVVPPRTLQPGWTDETPARWHTPAEVSAATLEVLADGAPRTLGVIRPWSSRPA